MWGRDIVPTGLMRGKCVAFMCYSCDVKRLRNSDVWNPRTREKDTSKTMIPRGTSSQMCALNICMPRDNVMNTVSSEMMNSFDMVYSC